MQVCVCVCVCVCERDTGLNGSALSNRTPRSLVLTMFTNIETLAHHKTLFLYVQ